jgi:hypothetical protein
MLIQLLLTLAVANAIVFFSVVIASSLYPTYKEREDDGADRPTLTYDPSRDIVKELNDRLRH